MPSVCLENFRKASLSDGLFGGRIVQERQFVSLIDFLSLSSSLIIKLNYKAQYIEGIKLIRRSVLDFIGVAGVSLHQREGESL